MSSAWIVVDEGFVRVLALERPPGNALRLADLEALRAETRRADADKGVRALVLASRLPRYFSSGLDLNELLARPPERRGEHFEALLQAYRTLLECPKPVIGALSGAALLGGWILAMSCDWRVLAADARISLSEVRLGLSPGAALLRRLSALASDPRVAKEMTLRGARVRAEQALAAGLVDELAVESEVLGRAMSLARRLAKSPPGAYASVKAARNAPFLEEPLWRESLEEFRRLASGPEAREGLEAMRDKRRPRWEPS